MLRRITTPFFAMIVSFPILLSSIGCETDREVLDVETPAGEIDVEQDRDTGNIEVDVEEK